MVNSNLVTQNRIEVIVMKRKMMFGILLGITLLSVSCDDHAPSPTSIPILAEIHPNLNDAKQEGFHLLAGRPPFIIDFWAKVSESSGKLQYAWDFDGDGKVDSRQVDPEKISLDVPGEYVTTFQVVDETGQTYIAKQRVVVIGSPTIKPGIRGVCQDLAWDSPNQVSRIIELMAAAGVEWVRMPFRWNMLEPSREQFKWTVHDSIANQLRNNNIEIAGHILSVPTWANGKSRDNVPADVWPDVYPPRNVNDFANFTYTLTNHYRGQIDTWIMFNEPNIKTFWQPAPNVAEYVRLLRAGYYAAKYANPQSVVVGGALAGNGVYMGWEEVESRYFLESMYNEGAEGYFDVMSIHPYVHPVTSNVFILQRYINDTRAVMTRYGDSRPIWVDEIGWSTTPNAWGGPTASEEQVASWVTTVFTRLTGVDKIFWYNFKDIGTDPNNLEHHFGLLHYDLSLKPGYKAYINLSVDKP